MSHQEVFISIKGKTPLDSAALAALLSRYPGIHVVPLDIDSPPDVLVWDFSSDCSFHSELSMRTALLILVNEPLIDFYIADCKGLFSKNESPDMLAAAIRQVARGEQYISPSLALDYLKSRQAQSQRKQASTLEALSEREKEILDLLAQGQSSKTIASRLYLSVRTVEGHLASIYSKLDVHSRAEAMLVALENR